MNGSKLGTFSYILPKEDFSQSTMKIPTAFCYNSRSKALGFFLNHFVTSSLEYSAQ